MPNKSSSSVLGSIRQAAHRQYKFNMNIFSSNKDYSARSGGQSTCWFHICYFFP